MTDNESTTYYKIQEQYEFLDKPGKLTKWYDFNTDNYNTFCYNPAKTKPIMSHVVKELVIDKDCWDGWYNFKTSNIEDAITIYNHLMTHYLMSVVKDTTPNVHHDIAKLVGFRIVETTISKTRKIITNGKIYQNNDIET